MMAMIAKEWRRLLRNPAMPWALLLYLTLPLAVVALYLSTLAGGQGIAPALIAQLGGQALNQVGSWQILMLAVAAPFVASHLIAGEVEDGTLEPLLASGPSLIALLLAKLAGALLFLLMVIVAGLPLFALPVLVGGVTWPLIGRTLLLEVSTVVMMTALGLLCSAFGRRSGTVALVGIGLGLFLTVGGSMLSSTATPMNVYGQGYIPPGPALSSVPRWLYLNPLVGLNSAINQSAGQGLFGLPGANMGPVWRGYRLWQLQPVLSAAVALLAPLLAAAALWIPMRFPFPQLRRLIAVKEVTGGD